MEFGSKTKSRNIRTMSNMKGIQVKQVRWSDTVSRPCGCSHFSRKAKHWYKILSLHTPHCLISFTRIPGSRGISNSLTAGKVSKQRMPWQQNSLFHFQIWKTNVHYTHRTLHYSWVGTLLYHPRTGHPVCHRADI